MFDFLVARYFYRMSDLSKILNNESYRSKAFFKAALSIDGYGINTYNLYKNDELKKIPNVGRKIEKYIIEIFKTGSLSALKELQGDLPDSIFNIISLPQLNYKITRKIILNGIYNTDDLKLIVTTNINELFYMGFKKSEINKIFKSLKKHDNDYGRFQYGHAFCIAGEIKNWLVAQKEVILCETTGGLRLRDEIITEIQILISTADTLEFFNTLKKCPSLNDITALKNNEFIAKSYLDIPVRITQVKENYFYYELLKSTGSKEFVNKILKVISAKKNLVAGCKSEREVFAKLNIPYVIPELRHSISSDDIFFEGNIINNGEYKGDLHVHTNWSDGIDSLEVMAEKAKTLGFKYIAICDHSHSLKVANGLSAEVLLKQIKHIRKLNTTFDDFKIIAGAEVDIKPDGTLDYPDYILAHLDFVVAAIHSSLTQPKEQMMKRLHKALTNQYVNVFAHPTGRLLGKPGRIFEKRPETNIDFKELLQICKENNVVLEINAFPERLDINRDRSAQALRQGVKLSIGTDSHAASHLQLYEYGLNVARAAGAKSESVLNTYKYDELIQIFSEKRGKVKENIESILHNSAKDFHYYFGNNSEIINGTKTVVGIDLTASSKKATGWAFMKSHHTLTKLLVSDDEIINETVYYKPDIISIDSPLSIPAGRCCTSEDCSCRKIGIMRYCEKSLMRMGIGVFPCLLPSMVGLTERGMFLAKAFREKGFEVIESYPGVAQDILKISRKQKGLDNLIRGLESFGITGDISKNIVHDEIDAITSALVGYFYLNDQYIPLGSEEENYLIIPRIQSDILSKRLVIGIAGEISSGKTTLAEYLRFTYGFKYKRYSQIIKQMLDNNAARHELQEKGYEIYRSPDGQKNLNLKLIEKMDSRFSYVIDGLRHIEDYETLKNHFANNFVLIFIDSSFENRFKRYKNSINSNISKADFGKILNHEVERNTPLLAFKATYRIDNNKGFINMFSQADDIITGILNRRITQ